MLNAAEIREDNRLILALEGQDYIATEVRYHRTCYQRYTHIKEVDKLVERREEIVPKRVRIMILHSKLWYVRFKKKLLKDWKF